MEWFKLIFIIKSETMTDEQTPAVIIDNGSGSIKAGIAGDDAPRSFFSSTVGLPKMPGIMIGVDQKVTQRLVLIFRTPSWVMRLPRKGAH